jgi:hypothetical protein
MLGFIAPKKIELLYALLGSLRTDEHIYSTIGRIRLLQYHHVFLSFEKICWRPKATHMRAHHQLTGHVRSMLQ